MSIFDLTIEEMTNTLRSLDRDKSWNCHISPEWGVSMLSGPARNFLDTAVVSTGEERKRQPDTSELAVQRRRGHPEGPGGGAKSAVDRVCEDLVSEQA